MSVANPSLPSKLAAALASRDERLTRRRLPGTNTACSSLPTLVDFNSGDYLSFATSQPLRDKYLRRLNAAPDLFCAGGSRALVNSEVHTRVEERIRRFFQAESALIYNAGYTANLGFFSCIPQFGDVVVHDENIHASVYDGMRASRARNDLFPFVHNSLPSLRGFLVKLLEERPGLRSGINSVIVAVESLYSMDGTFSPLEEIVELLESLFPRRNAYFVVDEAHCTGIYGPKGRGRVAQLGLESKVFARLITFSKSLAATGGAVLTSNLVRDYLLNYSRPFQFTATLTYANVIAIDCSFDLLEDGTAEKLTQNLFDLSSHLVSFLLPKLADVPSQLLSLSPHLTNPDPSFPPSPIISLLTPMPFALTDYLLALGMNTSAITPPVVPAGTHRVRVCLHAGNTIQDVEKLAVGAIRWAKEVLARQAHGGKWESQEMVAKL